jgi:uncharacterized membrane protein YiaA
MAKPQLATVGVESSRESRAIYAAYVSGILGFLVGLLFFWNKDVTLFEKGISLGFVGSILSGDDSFEDYGFEENWN